MRHLQIVVQVPQHFGLCMEIEVKFAVADPIVAQRLRAVARIGEFGLGAPGKLSMRDTFFDTRANDLLSTRHVLRVRQRSDGRTFLTFKAPAEKKAAIHRRPETEVEISPARTPQILRVGKLPTRIRKLVAPLVRDDALYVLFSISQIREVRSVRDVKRARRIIAEWSLDQVRFRAGERKHAFYELEVELKKTGTEAELEIISDWLALNYGLKPQAESKFARGLQFMRGLRLEGQTDL